jgi:thioredoxin reductase
VCGGGPAGLAAALWLGRYRRKTLVLDTEEHRNRKAEHAHGYLGSDGCSPGDFLDAARSDAVKYDTVRIVSERAVSARREGNGFIVATDKGEHRAQRLFLATGVEDEFPDIPGFDALYGSSIHHCPCCDGYEARDHSVLAIGWGDHVAGYALDLLEWGASVKVVTTGEAFDGGAECWSALRRHDIEVIEEPIVELLSDDPGMTGARLASGRVLEATKAFFSIAHKPRNRLAQELGCTIDELGYIVIDAHGETDVPGVYAGGDVTPGEQLVQAAAAQGAIGGIACAMSLRGGRTAPGAPAPGPDPEEELSGDV